MRECPASLFCMGSQKEALAVRSNSRTYISSCFQCELRKQKAIIAWAVKQEVSRQYTYGLQIFYPNIFSFLLYVYYNYRNTEIHFSCILPFRLYTELIYPAHSSVSRWNCFTATIIDGDTCSLLLDSVLNNNIECRLLRRLSRVVPSFNCNIR